MYLTNITYSNYLNQVSSDFKQFNYLVEEEEVWLSNRPPNLDFLYPEELPIQQDNCYKGYTYEDPNFEGVYIGVSYTITGQRLFIYRQFDTDIIFQSIYAPTTAFKVPTKSNTLLIQLDMSEPYIGIHIPTDTITLNLG